MERKEEFQQYLGGRANTGREVVGIPSIGEGGLDKYELFLPLGGHLFGRTLGAILVSPSA